MLALLHDLPEEDPFWTAFGFLGQAIFASRFAVQWWASERAHQSIVPKVFWYLSLGGSLILLIYAISLPNPVFITGQAFGFFVYSRNLYLISKREAATAAGTESSPERTGSERTDPERTQNDET